MINLADTARLEGRLDEARKLAEEADALNRRTLGPEHPQTLFGLTILSSVARDQGRLDDARKGYENALARLRRTLSARTAEVQRCMADYAWMLAAATGPRLPRPAPRDRAGERADPELAQGPRRLDDPRGGPLPRRSLERCDRRAEKSEATAPGPFTAVDGFFLAMAYWQLGEKEKGRQWYAKALQSVETATQPTRRELDALSIGGSPLAGYLGPEAALERRRLILNLTDQIEYCPRKCFQGHAEITEGGNLLIYLPYPYRLLVGFSGATNLSIPREHPSRLLRL